MYRYLRNTHLFLGLFSFLFVMMYGVSSVQMAHNTWFNNKPTVNESAEKIAPLLDARQAARLLMDKYGWRGELGQVNVRRDDQRGRLGNQVSALLVNVPLDLDDAATRLN